jgi:DNA-binding response OmpR family regulator
MLPLKDGFEVCRELRSGGAQTPILLLTARDAVQDRIAGLDYGADDYLTKPFGARELLARIDALLRRREAAPEAAEELEADGCVLDLGRLEARRAGRVVTLTPREAGILRWLHRHRARAVSRKELLVHVWGAAADLETRTVDVTIANLRQKIERDPSEPRIVVAVKGVGYAWTAAR